MGNTCTACLNDTDDDSVDGITTSNTKIHNADILHKLDTQSNVLNNQSNNNVFKHTVSSTAQKYISPPDSISSQPLPHEHIRTSVISLQIHEQNNSSDASLPHAVDTPYTPNAVEHNSSVSLQGTQQDVIRPIVTRKSSTIDTVSTNTDAMYRRNGDTTATALNTNDTTNATTSPTTDDTVPISVMNGDKPTDMMSILMAQTRNKAETGTDKASEMKRAAMTRAADEILPFLYLGAYHNVWAEVGPQRERKYKDLEKLGITQILTVAEECQCVWPLNFYYMKIPVFDLPTENIAKYFQVCIDFIDRARYEDGKVLVHCWVGVSRSASIVIAYLMARCDMRLHEAYEHVKSRRNIICPNKAFLKALEQLDKDLWPDFVTGQYG